MIQKKIFAKHVILKLTTRGVTYDLKYCLYELEKKLFATHVISKFTTKGVFNDTKNFNKTKSSQSFIAKKNLK